MEAGKQPYQNIVQMPVLKLTAYLKWKAKLEERKSEMMEDMNNS
jgi:hypothetical protein